MSKRLDNYLKNFFEEKQLDNRVYEVIHEGEHHFIETEALIDYIKQAPYNEKKTIVDTLRKIDFANGDTHHYLKFLAEAFIRHNY